jgi:hypothetical protein
MIKNRQIIFPKVIYRTPPENAFMNVYFYFYCVVKCGNRALGIDERIKKIFSDTKTNPNPPLSRSDRGPSGGPVPKGFRKRAPSGQSTSSFMNGSFRTNFCHQQNPWLLNATMFWFVVQQTRNEDDESFSSCNGTLLLFRTEY